MLANSSAAERLAASQGLSWAEFCMKSYIGILSEYAANLLKKIRGLSP
jgi:hypothetical protein